MIVFIVVLTFGCLAFAVMSLYWLIARPAGVVNARLDSMDPSLVLVENNPVTTMAERGAEPYRRRGGGVASRHALRVWFVEFGSPRRPKPRGGVTKFSRKNRSR